jgi:hypothetical protein
MASINARLRCKEETKLNMGDIKNPWLLYGKAGLFVLCGVVASALIIVEHPTIKVGFLLAIAIWCFARAYYFAFYVIQHYIDPSYRFAGLWAFMLHLIRQRSQKS